MDSAPNHLQEPLALTAVKRLPFVLLTLVLTVHAVLLLFVTLSAPRGLYNSPDEMATAFFAQGFAADGHLARPVVQQGLPSQVAPRGVLRANDTFIPVGFASVPVVVGLLTKAFGLRGAMVFISFLSTLALAAWFGFLRRIFGIRLAFLATMLTAAHPAVLYWGARPLVPNILFLSCVLFALFFIGRVVSGKARALLSVDETELAAPPTEEPKTRMRFFSFLGGLTLGIAVALRPHEGMWLALIPAGVLMFRRLRQKISWALFLLPALLPLGGLLVLQNELYGTPLRTGYHLTPAGLSVLALVRRLIAPFGIDLAHIGNTSYHYMLEFGWWIIVLALVGIFLVALKRNGQLTRRLRLIALAAGALAIWFLIFYGSFEVPDRFDRAPASIGTSFTRYFLPLYVLTVPFAAYALFALRRRLGRVVVAALVPLAVILSLRVVWWGSDESVLRIVAVLNENKALRERMLEVLPSDAAVFTDRFDKILFPHREVVAGFRKFHQPDFEALYELNLYYETIADEDFVAFENEKFWGPHRLKAVDPVGLGYRHKLYKLKIQSSNDNSMPKSK